MNTLSRHKKQTRKKRFNILLSQDEFDFLKKISEWEKKPIAEILRDAVDYLYGPENKKEKRLKQLKIIKEKNYLNLEESQKYEKFFYTY